jgi:hypothetical protein
MELIMMRLHRLISSFLLRLHHLILAPLFPPSPPPPPPFVFTSTLTVTTTITPITTTTPGIAVLSLKAALQGIMLLRDIGVLGILSNALVAARTFAGTSLSLHVLPTQHVLGVSVLMPLSRIASAGARRTISIAVAACTPPMAEQ